jgi:hypothetical protein
MKNSLTFCLKNGIQLAIDKRGEVFITLNGYIKLSGKPKQTISERTTRAVLAGKVLQTTALTVPGRGNRSNKLIPVGLACEWLAKDNPELAKAIDGNLFGFLQEPIDLSQFHQKAKVVAEIVPTVQFAATTNNLERFDGGGIELIIDRVTGEAFATIRGYARMSQKAQSTVQSRLDRMPEGERKTLTKEAEIQTAGGLQGVHLLPATLVFKWAIKDNPELAEAMGAAGATLYMHQLAGFKIDSDAIVKPEPTPASKQPNHELPPLDIRIVNLSEALKNAGMESDPHGKRMIQDLIASYRQNP